MKTLGRIDYESMEETVKIDKKDRRILSLLAQDARMPLTKISKEVKLSRDAVDYRIKRLEKKGIILQFFPNLNYNKLGFYVFHVFFLVDELNTEEKEKLTGYLKNHPNIMSLIEYSDRWDYEIVIIARDLLDFDAIILDIVGRFPNLIIEKDKLEIIKRYNCDFVPPLLIETRHTKIDTKKEEVIDVDKTDLKILRLLTKDCRMSTYNIGKEIGVSPDTVRYRIKNLIDQEVIRNFTILLNLSKMKYYWYTYTMEMKMFDKKNENKFKEFLNSNKNILRSAKTLGGWDLFLYLVVENPGEFHKIIKDIKNVFSDVVRNYQTWVAYKEHIYNSMPRAIDES